MGGRLCSGRLLGKESFLVPHFELIFTLETGGLVTFGHLGNFSHVKFKTGQLVVNTFSKGELTL